MKKKITLEQHNMKMIILIIFLICFKIDPSIQQEAIVSSNNLFSASIYKQIAHQDNLIFSAFSAKSVLTLAQLGAKGATAQELRSALNLPNNENTIKDEFSVLIKTLKTSDQYTVKSANKIYIKKKLAVNDDFAKTATKIFDSSVEEIEFTASESVGVINKWVSERTGGKINDLISAQDLDEETKVVLINSLYFEAKWAQRFSTKATIHDYFYINNNTKDAIDAIFMRQTNDFNYYESKHLKASFLELPFQHSENASLVIILPDLNMKLSEIDGKVLTIVPQFKKEPINVKLPQFNISSTIDFVPILQKLGVKSAFSSALADFSGIAGDPGEVFINIVKQKAFIGVNEKGVEAAAATVANAARSIGYVPSNSARNFEADRPFMFYIKVNGVLLFVGKVGNPSIKITV